MPDEIAIKVEHVSKDFVLPHEKISSVKSLFTSATKKRSNKNKKSETQHALKDISFEIKKGEFFGIVGRNGSGKSTLLKILAGIYQPTAGKVYTQGKLVPFIELGVGFNPELTGRENVYLNGAMLGFSEKEVEAMYDDIVAFAELERFMDQKLKNYSSGMQVRLAFSMATRSEADILLIDEVLAVGDADFQRKCFNYFRQLKKNKKTVVFVSHNMDAIREYCERAVLIDNNHIIAEGSANKVADGYGHLFLEELEADSKDAQETKQQRWGNGLMQFSKAKCLPSKISREEKSFIISAELKIYEDVDEAVVGFAIKNSAESLVVGTNNQLLNQRLENLKRGDNIHIEWLIPNILNDGDYYVNLSAETSAATVSDWWEEAVQFVVRKESGTGFFISPDIRLQLKVSNKG